MKVWLVDIDAQSRKRTFPNLALMKLSAWHKARGHMASLDAGFSADKIYASAVFTWHRARADSYRALGAEVGGSGVDITSQLPAEVESMRPDYDLYGIDYGIGFLQRGCPRRCSFCVVPRKEGKPHVVADLDDIINPRSDFVVLLDNNFLANEAWALDVLAEIKERDLRVCFSQGLDIRLVTPEIARALASVRFQNTHGMYRQLTFAFDHIGLERQFRRGVKMLFDAGIKAWQLQSFILCGYNSTFEQDMERVQIIHKLGIDPFVMLYRNPETGEETSDARLRHLRRWVNARIIKSVSFDQYRPWKRARRQYQMQTRML